MKDVVGEETLNFKLVELLGLAKNLEEIDSLAWTFNKAYAVYRGQLEVQECVNCCEGDHL